MNAQDRRKLCLEALAERGEITVAELSRLAGVSEMTIRRDLELLEREGLLQRVHGGAISTTSRGYEPPFALRRGRDEDAKERIARLAATLVADNETLVLDVGTTTLALAHVLADAEGLTIVTPSLRIADKLSANPALRVIVTGGITRHGEQSLVGALAERAFSELHCDTVFLGAGGVDAKAGVTEFNLEDTRVKRAALSSARRCVVLADSSKLGRVALASVCPLAGVDVLITDGGASEEALAPIRESGVEVLTA